jgi:hypothetical protein
MEFPMQNPQALSRIRAPLETISARAPLRPIISSTCRLPGAMLFYAIPDENLLLAGWVSTPANGLDAILIKTDLEGNEIWSKTYGGSLDEIPAVVLAGAQGFLLVGSQVNPQDVIADSSAAGYGGWPGRSSIYLAWTDLDGNLINTKVIGASDLNLLAAAGVLMPDGGAVILADHFPASGAGEAIHLYRWDKNGAQLWSHTWDEGSIEATDMVGTPDGGFILVGFYSPSLDPLSTDVDSLFIKVDICSTLRRREDSRASRATRVSYFSSRSISWAQGASVE